MARPRKKKHPPNQPTSTSVSTVTPGHRPPKSLVIRIGASQLGPSLSHLTRDFRTMMSPDTASRLKERRRNTLRDYTAMAGPLGVTHLFLFSRSKSGNAHLRVALTPRGPTLTCRVEGYTLARDVVKSQKRPVKGAKGLWDRAPLLVMNNFATPKAPAVAEETNGEGTAAEQKARKKQKEEEKKKQDPIQAQLETLTTTVFQGIFPAINPSAVPLSSIKRVLLLNREPRKSSSSSNDAEDGTWTLTLRHFAITTRTAGVSKRVKRFDPATQRRHESRNKTKTSDQDGKQRHHALPNLGKLEDAADYILGKQGDDDGASGYTSASETELDTDNEIEVLETTTTRLSRNSHSKTSSSNKTQQDQESADTTTTRPSHQPQTTTTKKAIKLIEIGPRMRLRLIKVEEGLCEGKVMWNEFVTKTSTEKDELEGRWRGRRAEKEERRRVQRVNVERKRKERGEKGEEEGEGDEEMEDLWSGDDVDDDLYDGGDGDGVEGGVNVNGHSKKDEGKEAEWEDEDEDEDDDDDDDMAE